MSEFSSPLRSITNTLGHDSSSPYAAPPAPMRKTKLNLVRASRHKRSLAHVDESEDDDFLFEKDPTTTNVDIDVKNRLITTGSQTLRRKLSALISNDAYVKVFAIDYKSATRVGVHTRDVRFATEMCIDESGMYVFGPVLHFGSDSEQWSDLKLEELLGVVHFAEDIAMWLLDKRNVAVVSNHKRHVLSEFIKELIFSYIRKIHKSGVCGDFTGVPAPTKSRLYGDYSEFCARYETWCMRDTLSRTMLFYKESVVRDQVVTT